MFEHGGFSSSRKMHAIASLGDVFRMPHIEYFDCTRLPHMSTRVFYYILLITSHCIFSLRFKKKFHCDKVSKMHAIVNFETCFACHTSNTSTAHDCRIWARVFFTIFCCSRVIKSFPCVLKKSLSFSIFPALLALDAPGMLSGGKLFGCLWRRWKPMQLLKFKK